jgi:hypothetical protein
MADTTIRHVLFDVNIFAKAILYWIDGPTSFWPVVPPANYAHPFAACLGIIWDGQDWVLVSGEKHLQVLRHVLTRTDVPDPIAVDPDDADEFIALIRETIERTGGVVLAREAPRIAVNLTGDREDDRVIDLAIATGAQVLVTDDYKDILNNHLSFRGVRFMDAVGFVEDVAFQRQQRYERPSR